jgi:anti-sigma regulatory factor (Ser/Thr protein kinase)
LNKVLISRMTLIIDEMNNNAIEHGSSQWDINKFRFKCEPQDNGIFVCIEVEDSGKWGTAKKALDMETLRAHQLKLWYKWHNSIRWRWLFMIIVNLVDRVYFKDSKDGWLIVWIKKKYRL